MPYEPEVSLAQPPPLNDLFRLHPNRLYRNGKLSPELFFNFFSRLRLQALLRPQFTRFPPSPRRQKLELLGA